MDKNTLSNYGWIVIAVLVLAVMIALATPFGKYIESGVRSTTAGLFETSEKAMNVVGMSAGDGNFEDGYNKPNGGNTDSPAMLEGDGQIVNLVASTTFSFRSDAPIDTFQEVKINGETVDPSNYTVTEGSTIVTFSKTYAKTLNVGEHNIEIISTNGTASAVFYTDYVAGLYRNAEELVMTWDELVETYPGYITSEDSDFGVSLAPKWHNIDTGEILTHEEMYTSEEYQSGELDLSVWIRKGAFAEAFEGDLNAEDNYALVIPASIPSLNNCAFANTYFYDVTFLGEHTSHGVFDESYFMQELRLSTSGCKAISLGKSESYGANDGICPEFINFLEDAKTVVEYFGGLADQGGLFTWDTSTYGDILYVLCSDGNTVCLTHTDDNPYCPVAEIV